jgi:hypothetical protein
MSVGERATTRASKSRRLARQAAAPGTWRRQQPDSASLRPRQSPPLRPSRRNITARLPEAAWSVRIAPKAPNGMPPSSGGDGRALCHAAWPSFISAMQGGNAANAANAQTWRQADDGRWALAGPRPESWPAGNHHGGPASQEGSGKLDDWACMLLREKRSSARNMPAKPVPVNPWLPARPITIPRAAAAFSTAPPSCPRADPFRFVSPCASRFAAERADWMRMRQR